MTTDLARHFEVIRNELASYVCRLVVRPEVADEVVQTTFLRAVETADRLPESEEGVRAWLFRVATNLAFDELRRHSTWRETMILDLRDAAEADEAIVEQSVAMVGSPETKAIAREHLVACLACTLRNLPERKAAALLLKEIHGFTVEEAAGVLEATHAQVKNWLQEARAFMDERYGRTCALVAKTGVCYQCVELDGFFVAGRGDPLRSDKSIDARMKIARELKESSWGRWHRLVFSLIEGLS